MYFSDAIRYYLNMKNTSLGKKLKEARLKRKLSKIAAAKQIGINVVTLVRIENGFDFHPETAAKIIIWI